LVDALRAHLLARGSPKEQVVMGGCEAHLSSEAQRLKVHRKDRAKVLEDYALKARRAEESIWYKQFAASVKNHHLHHQVAHHLFYQRRVHHRKIKRRATLMTAVDQPVSI
jgi:hypothetical protein